MTTDTEERLVAVLELIEKRLAETHRPPRDALTMSIGEAMAELGCGRSTVYQLLKEGKLKRAKKAGKHSKLLCSSVRAYQGTQTETSSPSIGDRIRALGQK